MPDIKPIESDPSQKNNTFYKEYSDQTTNPVIGYFSESSGLSIEHVSELLSDFSNDFQSSHTEIIDKYFPNTEENKNIRDRLDNGYQRYKENIKDDGKIISLFWRDILVNFLHKSDFRPEKYDKLFKVVASNGLAETKMSVQRWFDETVPPVTKSIEENTNLAYIMLLKDLKDGEKIESRLKKTQAGLEETQMIGREIAQNGKIPITRIVFFKNTTDKLAFLNKTHINKDSPDENLRQRLSQYNLIDIEKHTQCPDDQTLLSSWTYIAASEPWRYGLNWFGRSNMVIIIGELEWDETVWSRNLTEGSTSVSEVYKWYDKPVLDCQEIPTGGATKLTSLNGKKAALMSTEGEITVWGDIPIKRVVDLGP